jgi:ligand-binding sensor domain-containing protein
MASNAAAATPIDVYHVGPTPDVRAICHTGNVLWVGTAAGLFMVDIRNGNTLAHVTAGPQLPSSSVRAIVARGDSVFVGTEGGLALFRRGNAAGGFEATIFTPASPGRLRAVPLSRIAGLGVGVNGDVVLATSGRGAGVITKTGGYTITRRDSLLEDNVFAIADRADGTRYFATSVGLCAQVNDTSFVSFQAGAGIPRGEVRALVPAERNLFYLLVANHGVFRFDGARAVQVESPPGVELRNASAISVGSDGTLWAVGDGWVFARRKGKWSRASVPDADTNARWRVVVADGVGAFVGSSDGRVVALGRGGAFRIALPEGLPAPRVQSLAPDGSGGAWFVCDGRLARADATARKFTVEDAARGVRAIAVSPRGEVWTAGRWTVSRRVADAWEDARPDVVESDPAYTALVVDQTGTWVGTRSGAVYRYDGSVWLRLARSTHATTGAIAEIRAADDAAWAIANGRALCSHDGRWRRYAGIDSGATVVDLVRDPTGTWVAATEKRLFTFDPVKAAWVPARAWNGSGPGALGALRGDIRALAFDTSGRLVVGTTEGIALCGSKGVRWLTSADGIGGGAVADLVADGERLWIGFAEDGVSVISTRGLW